MSRSRRFAHSLISGYVQLAVNSLFILATVRLALDYLPHEEYALWMPVTVIATYIALMDFGLSSAASRILIDYKDHPTPGEYGSIIQTTFLVGLSQAALILLAGIGLAFVIGPLLKIPENLQHEFFWLVIGQCAVTAAMFATRIQLLVLTANQRFDVGNYGSATALIANCGVLWWGLAHGGGVYSLIWGQIAGVAVTCSIDGFFCVKLNLFPQKGQWGRPTRAKFGELFAFGRDVFLVSIGQQFISVSQTLLLTRLLGLEAALVWSICTRGYTVLVQIIGRIFDFSTPALAEMMVRGERERLMRRVRELSVLCVNLALAAGAIFAVANSPFVDVWTKGSIHWSPLNDLLLAVWLVITITVRVHIGLVGQAKAFRFLRYLNFIEGGTFVGLTILLHRFGGITIMLAMSILCSLSFTFPYGLWRTLEYFHLSWSQIIRWHRSTLALALRVAPAAALTWWLTAGWHPIQRLAADSVLALWIAWMFLRHGLDTSLREDALRHAPARAKPILARLGLTQTEG